MGHFGKAPDPHRLVRARVSGAGAQLFRAGRAADRATRRRSRIRSICLPPTGRSIPMVALATAATVIASQATISGTYSLTKQAIQLGYLPRMNVDADVGARRCGQIYIPGANWVLLVVVVAAVIGFGSSTQLASAYGVAVMGTMLVTTILTFFVIRYAWGYSFVAVHRCHRLFHLHRCGVLFVEPAQDRRRRLVPARARRDRVHRDARPGAAAGSSRWRRNGGPASRLKRFSSLWLRRPPHRVPGTAIFMAGNADTLSRALLQNFSCNKVLHERVVLPHRHHSRRALGAVERDDIGIDAARPGLLPHDGVLRLHGPARRVAGAGACSKQLRIGVGSRSKRGSCSAAPRSSPRPRRAWRCGASGCSRPWRATRAPRRLLQHPIGPGDRARHEDRDLTDPLDLAPAR